MKIMQIAHIFCCFLEKKIKAVEKKGKKKERKENQ